MRRRTVERQVVVMLRKVLEHESPEQQAAWNELGPVLHEEVDHLPEKLRIPVIVSYMEGKTNEELAARLLWPVAMVKVRLASARTLLRSRLTRRGALSAAFLVTALSEGTVFADVVPVELVNRTVRLVKELCPRPIRRHLLPGAPVTRPARLGWNISPTWVSRAGRNIGLSPKKM
jgi:Sigma-70, region 4